MTMRTLRPLALAAPALLAGLFATSPARAGDEEELTLFVLGGSVAATAGGAAIAFTAYSGRTAANDEQPSESWMTAQTIVGGGEALLLNGLVAGLSADGDEGTELVALPFAIWTTALGTYGAWGLGAPDSFKPAERFGVSWLVGADLAFTSSAVGYALDGRLAPLWMSIPEVGASAPQAIAAFIKSAGDERGRAGWVALGVWSSLLTAHGVVSMIGSGAGWGDDETYYPPYPEPPYPEPPQPDPYYLDPVHPEPVPLPPPPPPKQELPPPLVIPTPIPDSGGLAPGLMFVGVF
jgi:hypothetical protein